MFLRNAWYVAAAADEIGPATPLGRTVCEQRLVFFRGADGRVTALEDWCPHRGAPLSLGRVVDGELVCGYHGLHMGCEGRATAMPGQRVRGFPPVRRLPVAERGGFVWVWPGDAAAADEALLPVLPWDGDAGWAYGGGRMHVACDYRLMIDNLMDLTHETYVHAGSIGQAEIDETPCRTRLEGDEAVTERLMHGVQAPPFWQAAMRAHGLPPDAPVDRWQVCRFAPPSHVMIEVGVALAGQGGRDAPLAQRASGVVVDFLTPETATTMWYFWGLARQFRPDDDALTAQIRQDQQRIFQEDVAMLERQQANLLHWPQRELLRLNIDAGGVHARRVIERRAEAERGSPGAPATIPVMAVQAA
ncbi:aromatic ring-hydroxylating oxygenase subunit alpha [Piscinibacter sakaiensis]|uniref:Vanillate O-demethylase, oxygenase subunit n=1 Tax=Piscinibacter sakaiensis TaxID=1547922 RepID=A0A0K8P2B4_PISS1|nr:aromatic ring-hydroxylating dioxygenase subunit alpha [Piscinibacter sakaiensis]GAP36669.1 vanillate O-demethylase, oxygenase subunit [Piscinibacter sakaiensis]